MLSARMLEMLVVLVIFSRYITSIFHPITSICPILPLVTFRPMIFWEGGPIPKNYLTSAGIRYIINC
jgi:hypothetical protein